MREVEVGLGVPRSTTGVRWGERHIASCRILSDVCPLATTKNIRGFNGFVTAGKPEVGKRTQGGSLIGGLEQPKGCRHALPRQLIIEVAFDGIRTIRWQGSAIQLSLIGVVVERFIK